MSMNSIAKFVYQLVCRLTLSKRELNLAVVTVRIR